MRVPFEWLTEFIRLSQSPEETAHLLTMIGHEVESIEQVAGDSILEVNVTPNRPDCLSIIGIAREIAAATGATVHFPEHEFAAETGALDFNVDIVDSYLCNRYAGRIVRNLRIGPSPEWIRRRIEKCGIRSINNVVDVTNYVLLELGHPLHAFDLSTIKGRTLRIGTPESMLRKDAKVSFKTLDDLPREIPQDGLLIWDAKEPVAIAGVMGGLDTEVKDTTTDIFIESAYFDPISIRRTSRRLGLKTESSYRFERGADIKMLKKALDRAALLVGKVAGGTIDGKIDIYPRRYMPGGIYVRYERMNKMLGLQLTVREILDCLSGLGCEITETPDGFTLKPPSYRRDLQREADVVEEVARLYGYERIPSAMPSIAMGISGRGNAVSETITKGIRESLLQAGFTEAINFSFMSMEDLDTLRLDAGDPRRTAVQVKNPLRVEDSFMRTILAPSLIRNVMHNAAHGNKDVRLFEMARVFNMAQSADGLLPKEPYHIAAISCKDKAKALYKEETHDFYMMKGVLESMLNDIRVSGVAFKRSSEPFLHPGQSADIWIKDEKIGFCGVLSPLVVETLDIKAQKSSIVVTELCIDSLIEHFKPGVCYAPLPKFPAIERDSAIIVDASLEASEIIGWVGSYPSNLIEGSYIFDVYQGGAIPNGQKSIAFNVRYRALDRTLTDDEIDALHKALIASVLEKTKGHLRQ